MPQSVIVADFNEAVLALIIDSHQRIVAHTNRWPICRCNHCRSDIDVGKADSVSGPDSRNSIFVATVVG